MMAYRAALLSLRWAPHLVWNIPVDVGFLCDKAAVLGGAIKERPCICNYTKYFSNKHGDTVKFLVIHMDSFWCPSPFSVVPAVSRGQQAKRYRFDVCVFAATGDVSWVQLCVLIVLPRRICSLASINVQKESLDSCDTQHDFRPACYQKHFLPAWWVSFSHSAKTCWWHGWNYYVIYLLTLKFSIWKLPSEYHANTSTVACSCLLFLSSIGRSDTTIPGLSPATALQWSDPPRREQSDSKSDATRRGMVHV